MKKSILSQLLFCAVAVFALAFTSCVDDNEDNGMPYLEVTPDALTFSNAGDASGGGNEIVVKSNRAWKLSIDESDNWVVASPTEGESGVTTVELLLPSTNAGRSATLVFSLENTYGAYMTKEVEIVQGEIGAVTKLVEYIKETWPTNPSAATALNYGESTIEAVILANNAGGNNRSKLYVGDNITSAGSAIVLYGNDYNTDPDTNYPVGKKVTLDLSNAQYEVFSDMRQLKDVGVTVSADPAVELNIPSISAATLNTGNYVGQYVCVTDMTPAAATVGKDWAGKSAASLAFTGAGNTAVVVRMRGASDAKAFEGLTVIDHTGPMYGVAEQYYENVQLLPTRPEDIAGFFNATPSVETADAVIVSTTSVTLSGELSYIPSPTKVGFQYIVFAAEPDWTQATDVTGTLSGSTWTATVDGLTQGQKYAFRAYATNATATYYGAVKEFTPDVAADVTADFSTVPSGFPTSNSDAAAATDGEWTFDGQTFGFHPAATFKYYQINSTAVLIGKQGAYITLPAIAGKSLSRVRCTANTASGASISSSVMVGVYDASDAVVQGGDAVKWDQGIGAKYEYKLGGTTVNTPYRLKVTSAHNVQIAKIELWYNEGGTPGTPTISVDPKTLSFGAAADDTGKEVTVTTANADGLGVFLSSTDDTQFPMSDVADGKFTVKALANTSETDSKTATITVYLAETQDGARKAEATIEVSQAPTKPKTIAELRTQMKSMNPTNGGVAFPAEWVGTNISGYIAANNSSNNLYPMIAVVDKDGAAGSGMLLYGDPYKTPANFPVGRKISITITADSKAKSYNNLIELTDVETVVSDTESITVTPLEISANDLVTKDYQGMYVKVPGLKRSDSEYKQWGPAGTGYVDFANGSDNVTVATYNTCAWADEWVSPTVTGAISGIVQQNNSDIRLYPQSAADVEAFKVTEPAIVAYTPESISFPAAGGDKTIDLTILNQGANAVTASGLTAPFSASVEGAKVTVTATANSAEEAVPEQTLTLTLANGNSVQIPVSQLAAGGVTITLDMATNPGFPTSYNTSEETWTLGGYAFKGFQCQYNSNNKAVIIKYDSDATKHGYLILPAIADQKLVSVSMTMYSGNAGSSEAAIEDASGNVVSAAKVVGKNAGDAFPGPFVFTLTNPAVNTAYKIVTDKANVQVAKLELTYSK